MLSLQLPPLNDIRIPPKRGDHSPEIKTEPLTPFQGPTLTHTLKEAVSMYRWLPALQRSQETLEKGEITALK